MSYIFLSNAQIAVGNNNAGGLATLEGTVPSGGTAFVPVTMFSYYNPGTFQIRANGLHTLGGYPSVSWRLAYVTFLQEAYLRDTYCSSGYSGLVTVRTVTETPSTYANYNATMILQRRTDMSPQNEVFTDYEIRFTRMVAL